VIDLVQVYSEVGDMLVATGASGREYLGGLDAAGALNGTYKTDRVIDTNQTFYILDATDYRTVPTGTAIKVLSTSPKGEAALFALDQTSGNALKGASITLPTMAESLDGKVIHILDRGFVDISTVAATERPSMVLSGLSSDGTVAFDLASSAAPAIKFAISEAVTAGDLTALNTAINAASAGVTATLSADKASITIVRADANGVVLTGFEHTPTLSSAYGSMQVSGSNLAQTRVLDASQTVTALALTPKFEEQYASLVTLFQGQTPYANMTITAGSPEGTTTGDIEFVAGSDVLLAQIQTFATGNINITTTAGANVGDTLTLEDDQGQVYAYKVLTGTDLSGDLTLTATGMPNGFYQLQTVLRDIYGNEAKYFSNKLILNHVFPAPRIALVSDLKHSVLQIYFTGSGANVGDLHVDDWTVWYEKDQRGLNFPGYCTDLKNNVSNTTTVWTDDAGETCETFQKSKCVSCGLQI
jgi:hypothetical protein